MISRKLLTRPQANPEKCRSGDGVETDSAQSECDYRKAPVLNVLAAFWIQFMTHDWFSHLDEGRNGSELIPMGCATELVNNSEAPLSAENSQRLGCRRDDRIDNSLVADDNAPSTFEFRAIHT